VSIQVPGAIQDRREADVAREYGAARETNAADARAR